MTTRIAVASRDGNSVAGHIGKCASWIVFEGDAGSEAVELERINLPKHLIFHHYKDDAPHPLDGCSVMIGASAGGSFVDKMKQRGVEVALTAETGPLAAATDHLQQRLAPPKPRPIGSLICKVRDALS